MSMTGEDFQKFDSLLTRRIGEAVMQGIGVFAEDVQHKFEMLAEGQQMLSERMDRMEIGLSEVANRVTHVEVRLSAVDTRQERMGKKLDAVATDLAAHRADTESHHGVYRVKESGE